MPRIKGSRGLTSTVSPDSKHSDWGARPSMIKLKIIGVLDGTTGKRVDDISGIDVVSGVVAIGAVGVDAKI